MSALTRDGKEIIIGNEYYRANGEIITVVGIIENKRKAIVYSYIEGTAMDCKLYPSGHTEIEIPYEYESEEYTISFDQMYNTPPVYIIDKKIQQKNKELDGVSLKIGLAIVELKSVEKEYRGKINSLEEELAELQDLISDAKKEISNIKEKLFDIKEIK